MDGLSIAVDVDDVTVAFWEGVCRAHAQEFGTRLISVEKQAQDLVAASATWDHNPVKDFNWGYYGYADWWEWLRERDWLWATFRAVPGAIGGIQALRARGHLVKALTMKPKWAEAGVAKWMGDWRPAFQGTDVVPIGERKSNYSNALILIDDKPQNCLEWVASDRDRIAMVFTQPWNLDMPLEPGVLRVDDWHRVIERIDNLVELGVS